MQREASARMIVPIELGLFRRAVTGVAAASHLATADYMHFEAVRTWPRAFGSGDGCGLSLSADGSGAASAGIPCGSTESSRRPRGSLDSCAGKYALRFRSCEKTDKGQAGFGFWRGFRGIIRVVLDVGRQWTGQLQTPATPVQNLDHRHEADLLAFALDQGLDHVGAGVALGFRLNVFSHTQPLQQSLDIQPARCPIVDH